VPLGWSLVAPGLKKRVELVVLPVAPVVPSWGVDSDETTMHQPHLKNRSILKDLST